MEPDAVTVVVEIPKGSRNKYDPQDTNPNLLNEIEHFFAVSETLEHKEVGTEASANAPKPSGSSPRLARPPRTPDLRIPLFGYAGRKGLRTIVRYLGDAPGDIVEVVGHPPSR